MEHNDKLNFLAESIKNAKKVMDKVENGDYTRGNANVASAVTTEANNLNLMSESQMLEKRNTSMKNLSKSKMPEAILKSFRENPIIDPTQPVGMEMMMNEIAKKAVPEKVQSNENVNKTSESTTQSMLDTKLIEYIIKKTVEETLEQVSKKTSIDENIQIKIGEKTFGGKINSLKEIKK